MARPDKIQTVDDLQRQLDLQASKHRGLAFQAFKAMIEGKASVASMARSFNVNYRTMEKWINIYEGGRRERTNSKTTAQN